jgi:serine/threonine protein kinase
MAACRGHPSLVRFHAVCRESGDDRYCLLTEHVDPNLREVLAQRQRRCGRPFPEHEVRRMMGQVVCGAKAMHHSGIVHDGIS